MSDDTPELGELRRRLEELDAAYAEALAAVDALAGFPLPAERRPEMAALRARLNELCAPPERGAAAEPGWLGRRLHGASAEVEQALARQREFDSVLVQLVNASAEERHHLDGHLRQALDALVRYQQQVLPLMDARDRMASGLATARAELILEAFDRRLESLSRRLQGLRAIGDRVEAMAEEVRALRGSPGPVRPAAAPAPAPVPPERNALDDAVYVAFENRFRGSSDDVRERLRGYVPLFAELSPVADLGCGRGEFLELLKEAGVEAVGAESNGQAARLCRQRGLDVAEADLLAFLAARADGSLGGVFAAQVAEHLPPAVLLELLRESHRVLRPGGLLLLETVNPRSLVGFLEVYNRDLTHERPLHPETLSFLAAAAGFNDVQVELRSPVEPAARLQPVPVEGLPPRAAEAINENVGRLNALLYGPQEYALLARR
jgi:O-antigen chain-terminating methyltransferase